MHLNNELLLMTIEVGVPLEIHRLKNIGVTDRDFEFAREFSSSLAEKGDQILYKGKETARLTSDLIKCLAIMAFIPGGYSFYKLHFEVKDYQKYVSN